MEDPASFRQPPSLGSDDRLPFFLPSFLLPHMGDNGKGECWSVVHKEQEMPTTSYAILAKSLLSENWIKKKGGPFIYLEVMPWSELLEHLRAGFGKLLQPVLRSEVL